MIGTPQIPFAWPAPIAYGGTGAATAAAAFDALSPMSALGDLIYGGAAGTRTRLAGNTTTVKQFLSQTGDGANSAAPAWAAVGQADISGLTTGSSPTFAGLTLSGLTASAFVYANSSKELASLANAAGYLTNDGSGTFSWSATAAPTAHNLLSASHGDTLADTVVRGDLLVGNSTPKWSRKAKGSAGQLVTFDANDVAYTTALLHVAGGSAISIGNDTISSAATILNIQSAVNASYVQIKTKDAASAVRTYSFTPDGIFVAPRAFAAYSDGWDGVGGGANFRLANAAADRIWICQLSAANHYWMWYYNGSTWATPYTFGNDGAFSATSLKATGLTTGKIPIVSTGGLLIDGQAPLVGTKTYYVADASGGSPTRKLTFIDGILTAET